MVSVTWPDSCPNLETDAVVQTRRLVAATTLGGTEIQRETLGVLRVQDLSTCYLAKYLLEQSTSHAVSDARELDQFRLHLLGHHLEALYDCRSSTPGIRSHTRIPGRRLCACNHPLSGIGARIDRTRSCFTDQDHARRYCRGKRSHALSLDSHCLISPLLRLTSAIESCCTTPASYPGRCHTPGDA